MDTWIDFIDENNNLVMPTIDDPYLFPSITYHKVPELLDGNKLCRMCNRRHIKTIPKKCLGRQHGEKTRAWMHDFLFANPDCD